MRYFLDLLVFIFDGFSKDLSQQNFPIIDYNKNFGPIGSAVFTDMHIQYSHSQPLLYYIYIQNTDSYQYVSISSMNAFLKMF